ncbi:hypothetical protein BDQ94DRAFT_143592 [Aspergillus welwitschiae]|uniref:Uncharacterized protein n=1 Tax=Aspergillus welwitschiae TaxID=1341132 RepID=A0A3F3Q3T9_9EURO|nr:hypothetical protein BDQ94DRAFT_143592 [Aspergillus welwitschiae]RDH33697.1 hypothetical protein BDQ94DRAFT_143592 [Aspergillus welwitschiae]
MRASSVHVHACQEQSWPPIVTSQKYRVLTSMQWICKICSPRRYRTLQVRIKRQ